MKVLLLNTFDAQGGAARAAVRLLAGLRNLGLDARLLVQFKRGAEAGVVCNANPLRQWARRLKLFLGLLPVRLYPQRPENNFSPALLPDHLQAEIAASHPDLLHLHWLGAGFLRVETLAKLSQPLVWTLHDSWAFTGGCHVPAECTRYRQDCGACPVLGSARERDLSRWTWTRKASAWRDLNLTLVAPSRWLADCARSSSLFRQLRVEVIPNGVDTARFRPRDKAASRALLQLPAGKKIILFGAVRATSDRNKGFHLLQAALLSLAQSEPEALAVVFGVAEEAPFPDLGMPLLCLGPIRDDERLATIYSAADLFVAPSLQEAFCLTALEAMACGTPVVAFRATGLCDLVEHGKSGYLAQPYEVDDLARGIAWVLEDQERRAALSRRGREKVETEFELGVIAQRYASLYRDLLPAAAGGEAP